MFPFPVLSTTGILMTSTAGGRNTEASHRISKKRITTSQTSRSNTLTNLVASSALKRSVHMWLFSTSHIRQLPPSEMSVLGMSRYQKSSSLVPILGMQRYHFFRSDPIQKILSIGQFRSDPSAVFFFFFFIYTWLLHAFCNINLIAQNTSGGGLGRIPD